MSVLWLLLGLLALTGECVSFSQMTLEMEGSPQDRSGTSETENCSGNAIFPKLFARSRRSNRLRAASLVLTGDRRRASPEGGGARH